MGEASLTSGVTDIQFLDDVGIQFTWSGSPTGTFAIQVSADYNQNEVGSGVINAGNWAPLTLSYWNGSAMVTGTSLPTSAGSPIYVDLALLSAPFIRAVYTNTLPGSVDIATVADSAGSLNSTYFLIDGADGDNWYVWYNINSAGVDPAIADRTGIEVAAATGASADDIATATRSALSACTSIEDIGGATNHVTFSQTEVGPGNVEDGADPTTFTITYSANSGTLTATITAKQV